jgi:hypothetical protein
MPAYYDYVCEEHEIVHDGQTFSRIHSRPAPVVSPSYCFASLVVEDDHPHAPQTLADGTACFENKREVEDFCKKTADEPYARYHLEGRNVTRKHTR